MTVTVPLLRPTLATETAGKGFHIVVNAKVVEDATAPSELFATVFGFAFPYFVLSSCNGV